METGIAPNCMQIKLDKEAQKLGNCPWLLCFFVIVGVRESGRRWNHFSHMDATIAF